MKYLYVLLLEYGKYFIGRTNNSEYFRIEDHYNSKDVSLWTLKYRPLNIVEIIPIYRDEYELDVMVEYMENYGVNNVRGLMFSNIKLSNENIENLRKLKVINNEKFECYICGSCMHNALNCNNNTEYLEYKCNCMYSEIYTHTLKHCNSIKFIKTFDDEYDDKIMEKIKNQ